LSAAVFHYITPSGNRGIVAEERERENLAGLGQALKTFDRDKSINALQDGP
jgi:hypothetical protein